MKVAIQWKWKELSNVILAFLSHFFLKVAIQWKWKGLSTVILNLFSQPKPTSGSLAYLVIFFESRNSMKMKRTFSCDFGLISKQKQSIPFAVPFWKLQFNEVKRTFHFHFGFISHKALLNNSMTSKRCLLNFWLFTLKVKCSRSLREVLHGVGLPLPTLLQFNESYDSTQVV